MAVDEVPETGRHVELTADPEARAAIAGLAGVVGLPRLSAEFELTRHGHGGVRVRGLVSATIDQTCVVTLEPIRSEIEEPIEVLFVPQPDGAPDKSRDAPPADAEDPPEALEGGIVDLGAVAIEFLLLGIDPYPRKQDAVFASAPAGDPAARPFAALASLKSDQGKKDH